MTYQNRNCSYQYGDESSRANLPASSREQKPDSFASFGSHTSSNASQNKIPTNSVSTPAVRNVTLCNKLVGKSTVPPVGQLNEFKSSRPSKIDSNALKSYPPTKSGSDASKVCLVCHPTPKVVSQPVQNKSTFEPSDIKLNISTSSFPSKDLSSSFLQRPDAAALIQSNSKLHDFTNTFSSKGESASSSQKPDIASFGQSDVKSNTFPSSLSTKSTSSSPSHRPDITSKPNNFAIKATNASSTMCVVKSKKKKKKKKNTPASKPVPAVCASPKACPPHIYLTEQTGTSPSVQSAEKSNSFKIPASSKVEPDQIRFEECKSNEVGNTVTNSKSKENECKSYPLSKTESNTPTSSDPTKSIQSSPSYRPYSVSLSDSTFKIKPANFSFMRWVVKSNASKNSTASKPISVVSPTPFVESDVGSSSFKTTDTSKDGPHQSEFRVSKSNASKNSSTKGGPGPNSKDPKKFEKVGTERYGIPKHIKKMIKKDIVPPVLKMPLSPDTYADYFAALLYAEDYYCEKWSDYLLRDVTLKLRIKQQPSMKAQSGKKKNEKDSNSKTEKNDYPYVEFDIDDVPERRPFLLSRDHVHLKPLDTSDDKERFNGVLIRVRKSTTVLAEFDEDFHSQHEPSKKYDVSFSFNRVCLKRAHRAVSAAANPLLHQILFPKPTSLPSQEDQVSLIDRILNHKLAPVPHLIEGPFKKDNPHQIAAWMINLVETVVVKIYTTCNKSRVLICAPKNDTCDDLMSVIMKKVDQSDLFRANAAFREKEDVASDVMPACLFDGECFTFPPLHELKKFRIITSTFISTFKLYNAGLKAGHFSHIFLVDASFATEPDLLVALADLVSEETVVIVAGFTGRVPHWVRSDIGRKHGLKKSLFKRLLETEPYRSRNPIFFTRINT